MIERLKEIVMEFSEVDPSSITRTCDLRNDLGLNSLELAHMLTSLEDEFGVEIPDRDAMGFITLGDVENYLAERLD